MHSLEFWSTDVAGNTETHHTMFVNVDKGGPRVLVSQLPAANSNGWNNTDVTVHFDCADALSGVTSCPANSTVSTEGASQSSPELLPTARATCPAQAPRSPLTRSSSPRFGGTASPAANSFGWNNTSVVVTYSCSDALSGIASCQAAQTLSAEAAGQFVSGSATDAAGNTASTTVSGINIDRTLPSVAVAGVDSGATYDVGGYSASCTTADNLSGVASVAVLSTSGGPTGPVTLTCGGATDRAGSAQLASATVTINVRPKVDAYHFGGFQRPLAVGSAVNAAQGGSAVPVKFSLGGYRGMGIFATGFPASTAYTCGTPPPTLASEPIAVVARLTYDAATDTYQFVWKTQKPWTGCRLLQLNFSDGNTASDLFSFA